MNRVGIYFFFDKDGIVDTYVEYFLKNIQQHFSKLLIVVNGKLSENGKNKLNIYGEVLVRENKGFDVWAYKTGLEHIGWSNLKKYDELVMFNNTIFGPVFPFSETFNKMDKKSDIDFWGITKFFKYEDDDYGCISYGYIPEHIQSHFIAVRNKMLNSKEFKQHWDEMPMIQNYIEAVGLHEAVFTKKFEDMGYKWCTSVDMDDLESLNIYPLLMCPKQIIEKYKCPIFKRRSFFHDINDTLKNTTGEQTTELFEYLHKHTKYDTNMIFENIIRTCNQYDIVKNLNLAYILPENTCKEHNKELQLAIIYHVYFTDILDQTLHYLESVPRNFHVYITTDSEKKQKIIEAEIRKFNFSKFEVRTIENKGRDVSSLLVGVKDVIMNYDIACFAHDKKTEQLKPGTVGISFAYKCLENTLKNKNFINNVINTFEENPKLGLLTPPEPNHSELFPSIGQEWGNNFKNSKKLAKKLGLTVPISEDKPPIAPLGTIFWFRPKAMKPLYDYNWQYSDFPKEPNKTDGTILHAVERIYPFAVQQAGYYPAILMNETCAAIEYNNLRYYLRGYNKILLDEGLGDNYSKMKNTVFTTLYEYRHRIAWAAAIFHALKFVFGKPYTFIKIQYQKIKLKVQLRNAKNKSSE